jgi:DNA polymerase
MIEAQIESTFESWRDAARALLRAGVDPAEVLWTDGPTAALPMLAGALSTVPTNRAGSRDACHTVPRSFMSLARDVSHHRDAARWSLLYRVLYRLCHGEPDLLENITDEAVYRLRGMEKSVRRDLHKMHAFVRFRRIDGADGERYVAFHRPDHLIVRAAGPWFAARFPAMRWTIFTPDASVNWDGESLEYGPGVPASAVVAEDSLQELWQVYYANIFNPARIKLNAMRKEMPRRHWPTLPETQMIDQLLRDAPARVEEMIRHAAPAAGAGAQSAASFVPQTRELPVLREAARHCRGCELHCDATQTVFGEGPADAVVMLIGEQPGDQEDIAGRPFVGPAGRLLDQALAEVGIDRSRCYVTNAVKHFKFVPRGKRRIHAKPGSREIHACNPWLRAEVDIVKPRMIVALGATAARAIAGPAFKVTQSHGQVLRDTSWAPSFMATIHPSAILRIPGPEQRDEAYRQFSEDLQAAAAALRGAESGSRNSSLTTLKNPL